MSYDYDRRVASGEDDTEQLFNGFYFRGQAPAKALDDLVKAYRKPVDEFNKRFHAESVEGDKSAGRPMITDPRKLHKLIVSYLLENYGMQQSLARGFADQIVHGENY